MSDMPTAAMDMTDAETVFDDVALGRLDGGLHVSNLAVEQISI